MSTNTFFNHFNQFMIKYDNLKTNQHIIDGFNTAEIHTIVTIGKNKNISLNKLATKRQISNSAASQLTSKLESKGIIKKIRLESNIKKSALVLTQEGNEIFKKHQKQQQYLENRLQEILSKFSDEDLNLIIKLMDEVENAWDSLPWKD